MTNDDDQESNINLLMEWPEGRKLLIVTNREPYVHKYNAGREVVCSIPAGGVTAALDPVMQDLNGLWVAWGSGDADKAVVDSRNKVAVPPVRPKYKLKRVWLTQKEVDDYYLGYSNKGLWPLSHNLVSKVRFEKHQWNSYVKVNRKFANSVLSEAKEGDVIWVHDYQLMLVPEMIKEKRPGLTVVFFWHIPWPQFDAFRICPQHRQLLRSLMSCDMVGFHIPRYCNNFSECIERVYGKEIGVNMKVPRIKCFPISIDVDDVDRHARTRNVTREIARLKKKYKLEDRLVGCCVDRMDYTKGIPERLEALDIFFENYPEYREKFTFMQVCSPSRAEINEYRTVKKRVVELTERINSKFGNEKWKPVIVFHKHVGFDTIVAMYRMSDIAIVSPLADGMNLVAKEFIAAQVDTRGVLALSQFAGAAGSIEYALKFNPFERDSFAETIKKALDMTIDEKRKMMKKARKELWEYTIFDWVEAFLKTTVETAMYEMPKGTG